MSDPDPKQLLAALAKAESLRDSSGPGAGRRQYQRFVIRGEAELYPMDGNRLDKTPVPVVLRDVGRGGVGFVVQNPLPSHSNWRICFVDHGHVINHQAIVVRYAQEMSQGVFLTGAQFCAETGLLCLLGVDPAAIAVSNDVVQETSVDRPAVFLPPSEVA